MICPSCGNSYIPDLMGEDDFDIKYKAWRYEGKLIKSVWPNATPTQREQLQTGICSDECWNDFLGGEE
jgi:hypothetical protein